MEKKNYPFRMRVFSSLSFSELIFFNIWQHLAAYLLPKAPIHPTSNPSIPHSVYCFSFLGTVSFQRQFANDLVLWTDVLLQTLHLLPNGLHYKHPWGLG